jgi:hypothetical protein
LKLLGFTWTKPWLDAWHNLCLTFPATLEEIPRDVLEQPVQQPSPSFDGTVGGMVSFLAMHESYHVGQMVYVRRLLGVESLVN